MEFKALEIAEILGGTVDGNPEATVTSFARIESGKPGTICFFANPKYEHYVYECKADIIIVNNTFEPKQQVEATMVRVDDAYAAVAALLDYVTAKKRSYRRYRGCRSRVRWSAKVGKKVYIGDFAYVGRKAQIGDYTKIYENVYVGDGVKIGSHCIIYPGVRIYPGMVIGDNVIIHANAVIGSDGFGFAPLEDGTWKKIEHTGNVVIEDNVCHGNRLYGIYAVGENVTRVKIRRNLVTGMEREDVGLPKPYTWIDGICVGGLAEKETEQSYDFVIEDNRIEGFGLNKDSSYAIRIYRGPGVK
jgi:UDP-3-O-[3-hydroxymyristoyl] glucosamine N-acyltransferase